jgi:hypothetical protein
MYPTNLDKTWCWLFQYLQFITPLIKYDFEPHPHSYGLEASFKNLYVIQQHMNKCFNIHSLGDLLFVSSKNIGSQQTNQFPKP